MGRGSRSECPLPGPAFYPGTERSPQKGIWLRMSRMLDLAPERREGSSGCLSCSEVFSSLETRHSNLVLSLTLESLDVQSPS